MRLYSASSGESLRALALLKECAAEGLLTDEQFQRMRQETVCDLRTTNIYLRLALFFFTLIIVGAAAGLFYAVFLSGQSEFNTGVFLLFVAGGCYAAAEAAVSQARLYRHGIEEALAVCSVGLLALAGVILISFTGSSRSSPEAAGFYALLWSVCAVFSLWIWHRFGLWYALLIAMIFVLQLPGQWTASRPAQHAIVAAFYLAGLVIVARYRSRHRLDYLNAAYSIAEAVLWLGVYLAINLHLSSLNPLLHGWLRPLAAADISRPFYWATWALTWCLPPIVLRRGLREKDRFVIAAGAVTALLTFITNKPYFGWPRHTWDPMLLGAFLVAVALLVKRWLAQGENGIRRGFTAGRLSGKSRQWMDTGAVAIGVFGPQAITPTRQTTTSEVRFGGGDSGGGGASSDF